MNDDDKVLIEELVEFGCCDNLEIATQLVSEGSARLNGLVKLKWMLFKEKATFREGREFDGSDYGYGNKNGRGTGD